MVDFTGNHEEPEWIKTGLHSLDAALRWDYQTVGFPTRTLTQIYGPTSIGKSTLMNSLSCILGRMLELPIACLDLEHQSSKTIEAIATNLRYSGEWRWLEPDKKKDDKFSDEHLLSLLRQAAEEGYITILDSVAMIVPVAEDKGNVGDRNVGNRAYNMAQYVRGIGRRLKWSDKPIISFMANHKYQDIATGLPFKTYGAPGGAVKDNINFINIEANFAWHDKKKLHYGDGWILEGKVLKNRFGVSGESFWVYVLGGRGIHYGLTTMFDCIKFGLAEIKTGNKLYIKSTGEEVGRVSDIVGNRDNYNFEDFENMLKAHQLTQEDDAKLHEDVEYEEVENDEEDE